jgi:2-dehydropantoate 2-reductase
VARRFIVYGAGAIGGVVGCRLADAGHEIVLIARGAHREAIERDGLRLETPAGVSMHTLPVVGDPGELDWRERDDVVLLTVKSQDTRGALDRLAVTAGPDVAVACLQNGVANERAALRRFEHTYAVCVQLPSTHLEPGIVVAHSDPLTGSLDIGRYPRGVDETAESVARAFAASRFSATAEEDIMRWKHAKLLRNLANAVRALIGPPPAGAQIEDLAIAEGHAVYRAAGIDYVGDEEYDADHARAVTVKSVPGRERTLGSSWQSLARGGGAIESDYLNGEIVLLGRLNGVATPVNELLQRRAGAAARDGRPPGSFDEAALLAELGTGTAP